MAKNLYHTSSDQPQLIGYTSICTVHNKFLSISVNQLKTV